MFNLLPWPRVDSEKLFEHPNNRLHVAFLRLPPWTTSKIANCSMAA